MYQTARKLHMWLGIVLAVVLLIEAVTGLILAEPWMLGRQGKPPMSSHKLSQQYEEPGKASANISIPQGGGRPAETNPGQGSADAFGVVKGLHQGRISNMNFKWVIDFSAIGLVILTVTGVYIAIPLLKARSKRA